MTVYKMYKLVDKDKIPAALGWDYVIVGDMLVRDVESEGQIYNYMVEIFGLCEHGSVQYNGYDSYDEVSEALLCYNYYNLYAVGESFDSILQSFANNEYN